MASRKQEILGKYLDHLRGNHIDEEQILANEGGRTERQAHTRLRSNVGDRRSDNLALQMAVVTPLATAAMLALTADSPRSTTPSASPTRSNQALADEIDRQNAQHKGSSKSEYKGWYRKDGRVDPDKSITLILNPEKPITNPKLFIDDDGNRTNVKIVSLTLGGRPIFPGKSANDLYGIILDGQTISNNNPLSATLQNISKTNRTLAVYVVYKK